MQSYVTLFRMSTMEDWTDVMYINMYGCSKYGYEPGSVSSWVAHMCNNVTIGSVEHEGGQVA